MATTVFGDGGVSAVELMPTLLVVGAVSESAAATLVDRGFAVRSVDVESERHGDGESGNEAPGSESPGSEHSPVLRRDEVEADASEADCALVSADHADVDAVDALAEIEPTLPVLYAAPVEEAAAAGPALRTGADDRVLLRGERDGERIARRLEWLLDGAPTSNGTQGAVSNESGEKVSNGTGEGVSSGSGRRRSSGAEGGTTNGAEAAAPNQHRRVERTSDPDLPGADGVPGIGDGHDDRIGALLECAIDFLDADTAQDVAETAVETAERALGYDLVAVRLVGDDGETLGPVATSERTDELLGPLPGEPLEESIAAPAIEEGCTLELDREALAAGLTDQVASGLIFPLGEHGVLGFGSTDEHAFGRSDRRVGELLAANARGALDRIERGERIDAIHGAMREMLDARSPGAVAEEAVSAARSILGYRFVTCFLEGDEDGRLEPVAWTSEIDALTGGEVPVPDDCDGATEAFRRRTVVHRDGGPGGEPAPPEGESEANDGWPTTSRLHLPIADHGALTIATPGRGTVDESDVQLARLLATNTSRALDRVERTQELERLETVFETVNDMVYVHDEEGTILHCTPVLADRLGYDREEIIGTDVGDLTDDESKAEGINLIQELLGAPEGASRTQRLDLETGDGETVPVEIDVSLLPGEEYRGVVGAVRDISDLLAVRERLDSQQDRFEYLFENIPDPVVESDLEGGTSTALSVNQAFEETFGYSNDEIVGQHLNDVIVPEAERAAAKRLDERAAAGEINQAELERETQYGRREFLFRGVPYADGEGGMRGFGIYTDITDQKERERHLEVLQRLLRHNVRNDVNVLLAGIDQLEAVRGGRDHSEANDREAELLETLDETARNLLTMSQKSKRISKVLESETEELGDVDVASIAQSVVDRFQRTDHDAIIELEAPERCRILGTGAIERAIEELIGNALQHAGPAPTISVVLEPTDDGAELTVADDGPGIPAAERTVLERGEITPLQHGSGLGLWLVTHATAASGGSVSFDDATDGASVTLSFRTVEDDS